jgi:methyltransferase-like protein 23
MQWGIRYGVKWGIAVEVKLKRIIFSLPGRDILLDVISDVEALITDLADGDKIPCWAEIWPAARALGRYIWEHTSLLEQSVLEIGSGLGLPGTVCAVKGAAVTFSDYNRDAVKLSLNNAAINGVKATGHLGDWRDFVLDEKFDLVIGSDVFYDPELNLYVKAIIKNSLKPQGQLLLSHQRREHTYNFVEQIKKEMSLTEIRKDIIETDEESVYGSFAISIHHLLQKGRNHS